MFCGHSGAGKGEKKGTGKTNRRRNLRGSNRSRDVKGSKSKRHLR
jgi:hypothetical protein